MPLIEQVRTLLRLLIAHMSRWNAYVEGNDDLPGVRENQLRATRVYLISLSLILSIMGGYTALRRQTLTVEVNNPSQAEYEHFQALYPNTISCPCSRIIASSGSFITITASFHQVCSSDFVMDAWIISLASDKPAALFYPLDIRGSASSQFQLLTALCRISQAAVADGLSLFRSSKLVTPTMLSRSSFDAQVAFLAADSRAKLLAEQRRTTYLTRVIQEQNQLPSALGTNFLYVLTEGSEALYFIQYPLVCNASSFCSCQSSFDCVYPAGIYSDLSGIDALREYGLLRSSHMPNFTLAGMRVGCFPLNVLLQSTLECLFNASCLSILQSGEHVDVPLTVTPLNANGKTRFALNTTVQTLVDELLIEEWSSTSNYSAFYEQCHPTRCTYTYTPQVNAALALSTIVSLFGGLSLALKVAASILIKVYNKIRAKIQKAKNANADGVEATVERQPLYRRVQSILTAIYGKLRALNVFKRPLNDAYGRRTEIVTTRVYFALLISSLVILAFYTLITEHTETVQIDKPSITTYRRLAIQHPSSLSCPCAQITTSYASFISIVPMYHLICSSIYATGGVFPTFLTSNYSIRLSVFDFNFFGPSFFNLLPRLCTLSQKTVDDALAAFNATTYVGTTLTPELELVVRANTFLRGLQTQTQSNFQQALQLNLDSNQGNQLLTASFTNAYIERYDQDANARKVEIQWINPLDPSCNCGTSSDGCLLSFSRYCETSIFAIYLQCYTLSNQTVTGLVLGCDPMEGVLHSTLECLFDIQCIQMILFAVQYYSVTLGGSPTPVNVQALDDTLLRYFKRDTIILDIVKKLMVEQWISDVSYDAYFTQCSPTVCLYTFSQRFDFLNAVVTVIGLAGGLSVVLRILTPLVMARLRRKKPQRTLSARPAWLATDRRGYCNERARRVLRQTIQRVRELNWFQKATSIENGPTQRDEILTTRLYIGLFAVSTLSVVLSTIVPLLEITFAFDNPSMGVYEQYRAAQKTFTCSCANAYIPHSSFISLSAPTLHPVCSSSFINQTWISAVFGDAAANHSIPRAFLSAHFRLLSDFCLSSQNALADALTNFGSTQLISASLLSYAEFDEQMGFTLQEFYTQVPNVFRRTLHLILNVTLSNQAMSVYESNWYLARGIGASIYMMPRYYGNCSCGSSMASSCIVPLLLKNDTVAVTGMFIGCLPLSSLLRSSLSCFYDETCLQNVQAALELDLAALRIPFSTLDWTASNRFLPDTPLESVVNSLLVENWTLNVNYTAYFDYCGAKKCTYSIMQRRSVLVTVTKLIALYGGMTMILRLTARLLFKLGRAITQKITACRRTQVFTEDHFEIEQ